MSLRNPKIIAANVASVALLVAFSAWAFRNIGSVFAEAKTPVAPKGAKPAANGKAEVLNWEVMQQLDYKVGTATPKLKEFDGKEVRIPGFIVPLDFSEAREISEFLLTPAYPGCIHVPPPTPSQTVLVKMGKGQKAKMSWGPVWVTGKLKILLEKKSGYGEASFQLTGLKTEDYDLMESGDSVVNQALTGGGLQTAPKKPKPE